MELVTRAREVVDDEGIFSLLQYSRNFISQTIENQRLKYKYKQKYGDIAPHPDERLWVDPAELRYTIAADKMYTEDREYPNYGILGGSWDEHKSDWTESHVWGGLRERFEENKPWEETTYYQSSMEKLEAGRTVAYLDGPDTKENLEQYLSFLDELYESMQTDGYDPNSVITVHIGRDGVWMVGQGNHRRTIATIVGIESVPVRIKFRHKKWQERRRRFYEANSIEEIPDSERFRSHPDIPSIGSN